MAPGDLRLRLVAALAVIVCIASLHTLAIAMIMAALSALLFALGQPDRRLWRRLLHVEGFLLLLFISLPFTIDGAPLFHLGPLTASIDGLARAALVAAKVSASVLVLTTMLGDVEPSRLGSALHSLHVPERLSRLFVMTVRYTALLREEARRLNDAMRARGFRPRSNRHTWRSYGNLMGMLLVRALDRAERIDEAMLCRGYAGHFPYRSQHAPTRLDWTGFTLIVSGGLIGVLADRL